MAIETRYLFVVSMDVQPDKDALFNEVYDTEHVPYLTAVPGVRSETRSERLKWKSLTIPLPLDLPSTIRLRATSRVSTFHGRQSRWRGLRWSGSTVNSPRNSRTS